MDVVHAALQRRFRLAVEWLDVYDYLGIPIGYGGPKTINLDSWAIPYLARQVGVVRAQEIQLAVTVECVISSDNCRDKTTCNG